MGRTKPLDLGFRYSDTPERRCVSLEPDGIACLPVLGFDAFRRNWKQPVLHVHKECLEISLCLRGNLEFEMDGKSYPFRPGDVFVSHPDEVHRMKDYPRKLSKFWILFRIPSAHDPALGLPAAEARWLKNAMLALPRTFADCGNEVKQAFLRLFRVYDAVPAGSSRRRFLMRTAAQSLFVALIEAADAPAKALPDDRIAALIDEIRANPGARYSLDDLARRAALSTTGLLLRFKARTGLPPHAFVTACRIEAAKRLLQAPGKASVTAVAARLGFPSAQHFATVFRQATGCRPTDWPGVPKTTTV